MRIAHPVKALAMALCFLGVPPIFASDIPGPADPSIPAEMDNPADLPGPAEMESPAGQEEPGATAGSEEPERGEPGSPSGNPEAAGEDMEALPQEALDLEMTVYYDERTGSDYVEIRTPEKIEEYHYLSHIKYSDLIYVLSDLLRRITRDGYQWASAPGISYEKNEEVALLYRRDLVNDIVYGIVQFPDFKVSLSGIRKPDAEHRFNAENGRDMMSLVFSFAACLAQAEQTLGIKQLEYTMQFFKQE
jgi:hypothetical protein